VSCKILPRGKEQPSVKLIPHIWHVLKSRMQLALSLLGICHNGFVLSHPAKLSHSPDRSVRWFRYTHRLVSQTMRLAVFSCQWTVKSGANRLPISMVFINQHFDLASGPYTWTSTRCEFLRNLLLSWLSISFMFHSSAAEYRDSRTDRK
jgi:hypothetical protein